MLAKSRTLRLTRRTKCEMTSMKKIGMRAGPSTPAGIQPLRYFTKPFARMPSTW